MKKILTVAGMTLMLAASAGAAPAPPLTNPVDQRLLTAFLDGTTAGGSPGEGATAQILAMLGREDLVIRSPLFSHRAPECPVLKRNGVAVDPIAYIAEQAARHRVTMINEAHDLPEGRAFIDRLALVLRRQGYGAFAGETFSPGIAAQSKAPPRATDGYYVEEPVYGRLVRDLRRVGYRLIAYDVTGPSYVVNFAAPSAAPFNRREADEAKNLVAALKSIGGEKLLVHAGYGHVATVPIDEGMGTPIQPMAMRFQALTHEDVLTIDQTNRWAPGRDTVVCDTIRPHPGVDIVLGMPRPSFTRGRPDWRIAAGDHMAEIPAALKRPNADVIYEARAVGEPDNAVPMDRLLLRKHEDLPLLLPPGTYRVMVWQSGVGWSATVNVTVKR